MDEDGNWWLLQIPDPPEYEEMTRDLYRDAIVGREYWLDESYAPQAFEREMERLDWELSAFLTKHANFRGWLDEHGQ